MGKPCIEIPDGIDPSYQCFVGTKLVGNCTNGKIINGARYEVTEINKEQAQLKDEITENIFWVSLEIISQRCLLAHAMTYPKVQGCTEKDKRVFLHDLNSKNLKRNHLYVGLSRVTDGTSAFVCYEE